MSAGPRRSIPLLRCESLDGDPPADLAQQGSGVCNASSLIWLEVRQRIGGLDTGGAEPFSAERCTSGNSYHGNALSSCRPRYTDRRLAGQRLLIQGALAGDYQIGAGQRLI